MNTFMLGPEKPKENDKKGWEVYGKLRWFMADKVARNFLEKMIKEDGYWERYMVKEIDEIWLDGGGMVSMDEKKLSFIANDTSFGCYVRQLPMLLEFIPELTVNKDKVPGCVIMKGFRHTYVFAKETRDAMIPLMEDLEKDHADDIIEEVDKIRDVFKKAGRHVKQAGRIV